MRQDNPCKSKPANLSFIEYFFIFNFYQPLTQNEHPSNLRTLNVGPAAPPARKDLPVISLKARRSEQ